MTRDSVWGVIVIVLLAIILMMEINHSHQSHKPYVIHIAGYTCTEIHTHKFDCEKVENA